MLQLELMLQKKENKVKLLEMKCQLLKQNEDLTSKVKTRSNELVKAERLATIGTYGNRVAHDLKKPFNYDGYLC